VVYDTLPLTFAWFSCRPLGSRVMSAMLEPFQEGTLSVDPKWKEKFAKKMAGTKIDCSHTVFILTSNWGQHEIAEWCSSNTVRLNAETSFSWVQKPLIDDIVSPLVMDILKTDKNAGPASLAPLADYATFLTFMMGCKAGVCVCVCGVCVCVWVGVSATYYPVRLLFSAGTPQPYQFHYPLHAAHRDGEVRAHTCVSALFGIC
jgi:hypothetical protein